MARPAKVWFRKQDGWYYTTIRSQQQRLARDKDEATRLFHELMSREQPEDTDPSGVSPKFRKLADLFLTRSERSNKPETYRYQKKFLQSFCDAVGKRRVMDLTGNHVSKWFLSHPEWGQSTRAMAIQIIKACLNWGVREGFIHQSPLTKVRREAFVRRERLLTAEEKRRIAAFVGPSFRDFLFALEQTGMRPFSEAASMTAKMVDFEAGTVTFVQHKTARKGKKRVVYLPPDLLLLVRKLRSNTPRDRSSAPVPTGRGIGTTPGSGWSGSATN